MTARDFNGNTEWFTASSWTAVTDPPCTMACWFRPREVNPRTSEQHIQSISNFAGADRFGIQIYPDLTIQQTLIAGVFSGGSWQRVESGNTWQYGEWHHGCAIFAADDDRRVILDGDWANSGTDTTLKAFGTVDRYTVGGQATGSAVVDLFRGWLDWVVVWDVALTQQEVEALADHVSPSRVRPQNIRSNLPFFGGTVLGTLEIELARSTHVWAVAGTPGPRWPSAPVEPYRARFAAASTVFGLPQDIVQLVGETNQVTEGALTVRGLVRSLDEGLSQSEALTPLLGLVRLLEETSTIPEGLASIRGLVRQQDDVLQQDELATVVRGLVTMSDEGLTLAEDTISMRGIVRPVGEALEMGEALIAAAGRVVPLIETLQQSENVAVVLGLLRQFDEALEAGEALVTLIGLVRALDEITQQAETLLSVRGLLAIISESLQNSELIGTAIGRVAQITESITQAETIQQRVGLVRSVVDTGTMSEEALIILGILRFADEISQLTEQVAARRGIVRQRDEAVQMSEIVTARFGLLRQLDETLSLIESVIAATGILRMQDEGMDVTETVLVLRGIVAILDESVEISEDIIAAIETLTGALLRGIVRIYPSLRSDITSYEDDMDV